MTCKQNSMNTIGNLALVQFYEKAMADVPGIPAGFERGEFGPLLGRLRENVDCYGARYLPAELVEIVIGQPLSAKAYLRYIEAKHTEVYDL